MHGAAPSARRASLNLKAEDGALAADTGGALDRASRATGKRRQPVTTSRRRHSALVLAAQQESRSSFASASDPVFGRGLFTALKYLHYQNSFDTGCQFEQEQIHVNGFIVPICCLAIAGAG